MAAGENTGDHDVQLLDWTAEQVMAGVSLANGMVARKQVSQETADQVAIAHRAYIGGNATAEQARLLVEWADRAAVAQLRQNRDTQVNGILAETQGGFVAVEQVDGAVETAGYALKVAMARMGEEYTQALLNEWAALSDQFYRLAIDAQQADPSAILEAVRAARASLGQS